uniref:Uncharacterized protein n=1 Tax=Triticum urartu TaxID=4572 RepID=A0A8R7VB63_TRIUA
MRCLFHSSIHPSAYTSKQVVQVQAWQLLEHSSSPSCWRSPSPTPRRRPSSSAWPSAPTAPGRTSRPRKPSRVFRWRSSVRTSTATMRARPWVPSTAPAPSPCPWPPTSMTPTASRSSTAPPPTHPAPARAIKDRAGVRRHHLRRRRRRQDERGGIVRVRFSNPLRADQKVHHRALPPQEARATEAGA